MPTTITDGTTTVTPAVVDGWQTDRASRVIVHDIIGSTEPTVILRPAALRTGSLSAFFTTADDALALEVVLASGAVLTITDTDVPTVGMSFVATGLITLSLDDQTRTVWSVSSDFQEVG